MEAESAMKTILSSADIGIIGGADGPTAVFVAKNGFPWLLPLIACLLLAVAYLAMRRAARKKAHSFTELPEGYREFYTVDLQKNKKMMLCLNGMALLIALVMAIPAALLVPISTLFSMEQGLLSYLLRFGVLIVGSIAYIVLHELTHAIVMRAYGARKVRFGFTGVYAFAGSEQDYFDRYAYVRIALAPIIALGFLLAMLNMILAIEWFWVIYIIQISNVSGAVGDLFVSLRFARMPHDILIKDTGVSMTVYSKQ
jgi:hypothetical protein